MPGLEVRTPSFEASKPLVRLEGMDSTLLGRSYPPTDAYLVGREKVREFARAVFSSDPLSLDPEAARAAGYADVVAPPTFAVLLQELTLRQLIADETAGIELTHLVHGDQTFAYARPIVAGDELTAVFTITGVRELGGNTMITADSVVTDAGGAHVVTMTSTLVLRGEAAA